MHSFAENIFVVTSEVMKKKKLFSHDFCKIVGKKNIFFMILEIMKKKYFFFMIYCSEIMKKKYFFSTEKKVELFFIICFIKIVEKKWVIMKSIFLCSSFWNQKQINHNLQNVDVIINFRALLSIANNVCFFVQYLLFLTMFVVSYNVCCLWKLFFKDSGNCNVFILLQKQ